VLQPRQLLNLGTISFFFRNPAAGILAIPKAAASPKTDSAYGTYTTDFISQKMVFLDSKI